MANVSSRAFLLAEALSLVSGLWTGPAQAAAPRIEYEPVATWSREEHAPSQPAERLYLAVRLNAQERGVFEFRRSGSTLMASDATLRKIGLAAPAAGDTEERALTDIAGLLTNLNEALQAVDLTAHPDLLAAPPVAMNQSRRTTAAATSATGMVLNYDAYAGGGGGTADASGLFALRAFSGRTVLETTGLGQWRRSGAQDRTRAIRLDTTLSHVWPDRKLRLHLGDFITGSTGWSRPTRLGGLQIGTDFSLQPYLPTAPMPAFMGSAALPSQVELFVDGVKRWDGEVAAGRFTVGTGPGRIDGQGKAQLVMTDILGRVSTQEFTFYETTRLLRKDLTEWSAAIGAPRLEYGDLSLAYADEPVASGSWRRGMTDRLTLEAHGEASVHAASAGMGAAWLLGMMGELRGSFAASTGSDLGWQWTLGYSWRAGNFHFSADLRRASRSFADISSRWGGGPPLAIDNVQIGYSNRDLGALSVGYLGLQQADDRRSRIALLNWSRPFTRALTINASLRQNIDKHADRGAFISLSLTPGANRYASLGLQSQGSGLVYTGSFQQNAPIEGGIGWRADLLGTSGSWKGQAQVNWLGDYGEAQARVEAMPGSRFFQAGLSGSLAMLDGTVYASRRIEDGFALVSTGEATDVPVLVHNRVVGKSGSDGRLLVTQLRAFEENAIAIDPAALDQDYAVGEIDAVAVPSDRAGVHIAFAVRRIHSAIATITDRSGRFVPAGASASIEGRDEPATIGFDGLLYLENPPAGARVVVDLGPGAGCAVQLPEIIPPGMQSSLGALICEMTP